VSGGGGKSQLIGYRYLMGVHMGLARGPIDELVHIQVGELTAWAGSQSEEGEFEIDAPKLFGGDKREGGISGTVSYMPGHATQGVTAKLAAMLGGLVPAFRGVTTMFYDGIVCSMNPYPKTWKMRMRRTTSGWDGAAWYPEKATIWLRNNFIDVSDQTAYSQTLTPAKEAFCLSIIRIFDPGYTPPAGGGAPRSRAIMGEYMKCIKAMNPAHILFEAATNHNWSRGLPRSMLDEASFRAAADTLYDERFGMCIKWSRSDSVSSLIQTVLDHIGAAQYFDRTTGLLTLKLIRDNYDVNSLPLFTPDSGLLGVDDDDSSTSDLGATEFVVTWTDPVTGKEGQVREQNIASIQSQDSVNSTSKSYPGLPTSELAHRVALRDLQAVSSGVKRYKVRLDRAGRKIAPASVFRISDPARGIVNLVLRAGDIDDGKITEGTITVIALQDVFGMPATGLSQEQPGTWVPPDINALPVATASIGESTFRALVRAIGISDATAKPADACYLGTVALAPSPLSLGYTLESKPDGAPGYLAASSGGWCPTAILGGTLTRAPDSVAVPLSSVVRLEEVSIGSAVLIGEEVCRVDVIDFDAAVLTISRGCVDTQPEVHPAGTRIWFYETAVVADPSEYLPGESVSARLITRTSSQTLDPDMAPLLTIVTKQRQARPYPPANVQANGVAGHLTFAAEGDMVFTWAHRDRLVQQDQIIDHVAASVGPEAGTTYTARISVAGTLIVTYANITGSTWTYTAAQRAIDGITGAYSVELLSVRSGLACLYPFNLTSAPALTGLGNNLGAHLGT
jgi:hypothetical protein